MNPFPSNFLPMPPTVSSLSIQAGALGNGQGVSDYASAVYIAANRALYIPFRVSSPILVTKLFALNGTAVSGNIDMGIYDFEGRALVTMGTTVQAGTSAAQVFDITDTRLDVGDFFLGVAMDNVTGTLFRAAPTSNQLRRVFVRQQASAFPLPTTTATFAAPGSSYIPLIGLRQGGLVL